MIITGSQDYKTFLLFYNEISFTIQYEEDIAYISVCEKTTAQRSVLVLNSN